MNTVILHGVLADKYGERHRYHVASPREALRALTANKPGFAEDIRQIDVRLIRSKPGVQDGLDVGEDDLHIGMSNAELHVIPMPAGSGKSGIGKIIAGVVLIGAVILTGGGAAAFTAAGGGFGGVGAAWAAGAGSTFLGLSGGTVMLAGAAMALGGAAMMLAPTPKMDSADQKASFLFGQTDNATGQGAPVPLVYGLNLTGSVVIALGVTTEQIAVGSAATYNGSSVFGGIFGGMFDGDLLTGTFIGGTTGFGGEWVIDEVDNTLTVVTQLNLED